MHEPESQDVLTWGTPAASYVTPLPSPPSPGTAAPIHMLKPTPKKMVSGDEPVG